MKITKSSLFYRFYRFCEILILITLQTKNTKKKCSTDSIEFNLQKLNNLTCKIVLLAFCRILLFGAGRRNCVGEVLAKNRIFLFFSCLFQKFKFLPSNGEYAPIHDPRTYRFAIALMINEYKIIAQPRSKGEY